MKLIQLAIALIVTSVFSGQQICAQGSAGLVGHWNFNGNANDVSGNGLNGTVVGAVPAAGQLGVPNTGYFFDGGDYIQVPHDPSMNINGMSICALFRPDTLYSGPCQVTAILFRGTDNGPQHYRLDYQDNPYIDDCNQYHPNNANHTGALGQMIGGPTQWHNPAAYVQYNQWRCVVATYQNDTARMYVNGILTKELYNNNTVQPSTFDLFFGRNQPSGFPYWFYGVMDDIRLYNRALSPSEVQLYCDSASLAPTALPTGSIQGSTGCANEPLTLTFNAASGTGPFNLVLQDGTGALYTPLGVQSGVPFNLNPPPPATTTFTLLSITDATGSINTAPGVGSVTLTVLTPPTADAGPDQTLCPGFPTTLAGSGGGQYQWFPIAGISNPNAPSPTYINQGTGGSTNTLFLQVTDPNTGCRDTDAVVITSLPQPTASAGPDLYTCGPGQVLQGSGGGTYQWSPAGSLSDPTSPTPTASPAATTTYTLIVTSPNGCTDTDAATVFIITEPVTNAGPDIAVCTGATGVLQGSTVGGNQYLWTPTAGLSDPTSLTPVVTPTGIPGPVTYTLTTTAPGGCSSSDSAVVTLLPPPAVYAGPDQNTCAGLVTLNGSGTGTLVWSGTDAGGLSDPTASNPTITLASSSTFILTATSAEGCTATDVVLIGINASVPHTVSPDTSHLCPGDSVQLLVTGGQAYLWIPAEGLTPNNTVANPWANPDSSTTYQVVIYDEICGTTDTLSSRVERHGFPVVNAYSSNDLDCRNGYTILYATGAVNYGWSPAETLLTPGSDSTRANPSQSTTYFVVGVDEWGCVGQSKVDVTSDKGGNGVPLVPNAFTPDGDNVNDCYRLTLPGAVSEFVLRIYNRWGQQVYSTTDPNGCWDGRYKGAMCELGTYVYYYTARDSYCGPLQGQGNFTLLR